MLEETRHHPSSFLPPVSSVLALALLTVLIFADVLLRPAPPLLSDYGTDLSTQFLFWREFGFSELRHGNFALWNPYVFCGMPFFGMFQSALLYPPNWLYLVLPLVHAVNFGIALHVFLLGLFMLLWLSRCGLHPLASLLGAILAMFSGPYFLHIYAGHLTSLCAMTWTPLILLCVDGLLGRPSLRWFLLAAFAVTMQLLAGHPHQMFYALVTVILYAGLGLVRPPRRFGALALLAGAYAFAFCIGAAQVLAGAEMGKESLRSGGLSIEVAGMLSFPPENLLTLIAPKVLGMDGEVPYWGRWYFWETSLFFSVTGLVLACIGLAGGGKVGRLRSGIIAGILIILALGHYTPVFSLLYHWVPGFNSTRGNSKFSFYAILFLTRLAAGGFDRVCEMRRTNSCILHSRLMFLAALGAGLVVMIAHSRLHRDASYESPPLMSAVFARLQESGESYAPDLYTRAGFARQAATQAHGSLFIAGMTFAFVAMCFPLWRGIRLNVYFLFALAVVEILVFAAFTRKTFDPERAYFRSIERFVRQRPGDYRILQTFNENNTIPAHIANIWGYDPGVPRRYAEFMAFTQGQSLDRLTDQVVIKGLSPLHRLLRCRYCFERTGEGFRIVAGENPLPHLLLVRDYRVEKDRDAIFRALAEPTFDPLRTVLLESEPRPAPAVLPAPGGGAAPASADAPGTATLVDSSTDHLTVAADLAAPAILLITDGYSRGWRARPVGESAQESYDVIPADYVLRAVPLSAGRHHVRIEYLPDLYRIGKWVSILSLILYTALLVWVLRRKDERRRMKEEG
jgi:hypothetical protein